MAQHWGLNRLNKRGFARRLHALTHTLRTRFALVATCSNTCIRKPAPCWLRCP